MLNLKIPLVKKMKAHLKSKNFSWDPNSKFKEIYFDKPIDYIFQKKTGTTLVLNSKKNFFPNKDIFAIIKTELKGKYLVGYFSYEFNIKNSKGGYDAIFNIFCRQSEKPKTKNHTSPILSNFLKSTNDKDFISSVKNAKKLIEKGEIYQINLTREFSYLSNKDNYRLFLDYFKNQPVEFGCYIEFFDHVIISGSMELFLRRNKNTITTKPIKGTAENQTNSAKALDKDLKERAENLMIVDLMRNDLSRICKPGSVKVDKLFKKKKYSTLTQLESTVTGKLNKQTSLKEIFTNTMPPGSVTGTPKSRAIQIISKIESHRRGPYCGAVGYIKPNQDFCFSVGIRLSKINEKKKLFFTGAGIVWDSVPHKENAESHLKAKAFQNTLSSS